LHRRGSPRKRPWPFGAPGAQLPHFASALRGSQGDDHIHAMDLDFSDDELRRYSRHILLAEVGAVGQAKLRAARVLIVGAGGLGSPLALYLAAAGVGTLGILDSDIVDESNLQRQVLHSTDRVGQPKTTSARMALQALNPDVHVIEHQQRLVAEDALALFQDYDLVIDGSDNFSTRYLVNDACVRLGKPFVHGSVFRFEGQVAVFHPGHGPCYRCLYPEPPPPELAPSCADAGVLGVLPGVIGVLQATEALKLLLGVGEPLIGRSLRFDALAGRFRELRYAADPHCACCGSQAQHGALHDEAFVCATA
jgi:sulfur-carrier protein adenylyltransferase/sulfurtransferase